MREPGQTLHAAAAASRREHLLGSQRVKYPPGMAELPDKLEAIASAVAAFAVARAPYALIGGLAVGIHSGVPRATLDVDFAVSTQSDYQEIRRQLELRGFTFSGAFAHSMNFRHSSGEPVQLAFDPQFDEMLARAHLLQLEGLALRVVTREDLITMKKRAATDPARRRSKALRDQADVALLEGDVPDPNEGW